ncbi:uncharacterized protein LOC116944420 [Petromyzon marinus]|uniref:Forkhead box protein M1-like isoform X2 n=1 Tax=Petromyzon marinus TaxID=7757 RepID=A0AAJ7WXP2_PETMA|nr:forkhead box protein M1-like isoform X2 [Petromyzon marinus]
MDRGRPRPLILRRKRPHDGEQCPPSKGALLQGGMRDDIATAGSQVPIVATVASAHCGLAESARRRQHNRKEQDCSGAGLNPPRRKAILLEHPPALRHAGRTYFPGKENMAPSTACSMQYADHAGSSVAVPKLPTRAFGTAAVGNCGAGIEKGAVMNKSLTSIQWLGRLEGERLLPGVAESHPAVDRTIKQEQSLSSCGRAKVASDKKDRGVESCVFTEATDAATANSKKQQDNKKDNHSNLERPLFSYMAMIQFAINSSSNGRMSLREIYAWIAHRFPYFRHSARPGWRNSIRHNLSLHTMFVRETVPGSKESFWTVSNESTHRRHASIRDTSQANHSALIAPSSARRVQPLLPRPPVPQPISLLLTPSSLHFIQPTLVVAAAIKQEQQVATVLDRAVKAKPMSTAPAKMTKQQEEQQPSSLHFIQPTLVAAAIKQEQQVATVLDRAVKAKPMSTAPAKMTKQQEEQQQPQIVMQQQMVAQILQPRQIQQRHQQPVKEEQQETVHKWIVRDESVLQVVQQEQQVKEHLVRQPQNVRQLQMTKEEDEKPTLQRVHECLASSTSARSTQGLTATLPACTWQQGEVVSKGESLAFTPKKRALYRTPKCRRKPGHWRKQSLVHQHLTPASELMFMEESVVKDSSGSDWGDPDGQQAADCADLALFATPTRRFSLTTSTPCQLTEPPTCLLSPWSPPFAPPPLPFSSSPFSPGTAAMAYHHSPCTPHRLRGVTPSSWTMRARGDRVPRVSLSFTPIKASCVAERKTTSAAAPSVPLDIVLVKVEDDDDDADVGNDSEGIGGFALADADAAAEVAAMVPEHSGAGGAGTSTCVGSGGGEPAALGVAEAAEEASRGVDGASWTCGEDSFEKILHELSLPQLEENWTDSMLDMNSVNWTLLDTLHAGVPGF